MHCVMIRRLFLIVIEGFGKKNVIQNISNKNISKAAHRGYIKKYSIGVIFKVRHFNNN